MSDGGPLRYGALAAFVVYATFSVIVTVVLTANRDKLFIRERGFAYVLFSSIVSIYVFATLAVADSLTDTSGFNCGSMQWPVGVFFFPLYFGPQIIRGTKYWVQYSIAKSQMKVEASMAFKGKKVLKWTDFFFLRNKWVVSTRVYFIMLAVVALLVILIAVIVEFCWQSSTSVYFSSDTNIFGLCLGTLVYNMGLQAVCVSMLLFVCSMLVLQTRAIFLIKEEYGVLIVVTIPLFILWGVITFASNGSFYGFREVHVLMMMMFAVQIVNGVFPIFLLFSHNQIERVAISSSGGPRGINDQTSLFQLFRKSLVVPELRESFKEFVVECLCTESLIFFLRASAYEQLLPQRRREEALSMREMFLVPNGAFEINIDSDLRDFILDRIERNEIDETLFETAKKIVLHDILQNPFTRWIRSVSFRRAWERAARNHNIHIWSQKWGGVRRPSNGNSSDAEGHGPAASSTLSGSSGASLQSLTDDLIATNQHRLSNASGDRSPRGGNQYGESFAMQDFPFTGRASGAGRRPSSDSSSNDVRYSRSNSKASGASGASGHSGAAGSAGSAPSGASIASSNRGGGGSAPGSPELLPVPFHQVQVPSPRQPSGGLQSLLRSIPEGGMPEVSLHGTEDDNDDDDNGELDEIVASFHADDPGHVQIHQRSSSRTAASPSKVPANPQYLGAPKAAQLAVIDDVTNGGSSHHSPSASAHSIGSSTSRKWSITRTNDSGLASNTNPSLQSIDDLPAQDVDGAILASNALASGKAMIIPGVIVNIKRTDSAQANHSKANSEHDAHDVAVFNGLPSPISPATASDDGDIEGVRYSFTRKATFDLDAAFAEIEDVINRSRSVVFSAEV